MTLKSLKKKKKKKKIENFVSVKLRLEKFFNTMERNGSSSEFSFSWLILYIYKV